MAETVPVGVLEAVLRLRDELTPMLDKTLPKIDDAAKNLEALGSSALKLGGIMTAITAPIALVAKSSIQMAMEAIESENLVAVSFEGMTESANAWSKNLASSLGLNEYALRKSAGILFTMTSAMGMSKEAAFDMSTGVAELAADFASFYNMDNETAFNKIRSGLVGETEGLRQLGILIDETTIKQWAWNNGLVAMGAQLTQAEKVQARYGAILEQTSKAQGDLARTIDSPTNKLRVMGEQFDQLKIKLGMALMPLFEKFIGLWGQLMPSLVTAINLFIQLSPQMQLVVAALTAMAVAIGPMLISFGGMALGLSQLMVMFPALAGFVTAAGATISAFALPIAAVVAGFAAIVIASGGFGQAFQNIKAVVIAFGEALYSFVSGILEAYNLGLKIATFGMLDFKTILDLGKASVQFFFDAVKFLTFGLVDLNSVFNNTSMIGDALAVTWLSMKNGLVNLAMAALYAKKFLMFDGDPMKAAVQKDIDALRELKLEYSDAATKIVFGAEKTSAAVAATVAPVIASAAATKDLGGKSKLTAEQMKTLVEAQKEAEKAGKKNAESQIKQNEALEKFNQTYAWENMNEMALASAAAAKAEVDFKKMIAGAMAVSPLIKAAEQNTKALADSFIEAQRAWDDHTWEQEHQMAPTQIKKAQDAIGKASRETMDWGKVLGTVSDVFEILGVSSESALGKTITALTAAMSISKEVNKLMTGEGGKKLKFGELDDTKKAQVALAGLNVAMVAYKSGALGGAAAGATFGASFGPWGPAIGGAVGGLLGLVGGMGKAEKAAKAAKAEVEKMRAEFVKTQGGLDALAKKAQDTGYSLDKMFKAQTVKDYEAAVKELQGAFDLQKKAQEDLTAAMDKYGISIEQLGPKFRQQKLDEMAMDIFKDFSLLTAAGVDYNLVIEKMGPAFNDYVNKVVTSGATLPEQMRPMIMKMIELGLLVDENGDKFEDLSKLNFAETLEESVQSLILSIKELVNALLGIPNVQRSVTVDTRRTGGGGPADDNLDNGRGYDVAAANGFNGTVTSPTRFLVGEDGPERVSVMPLSRVAGGESRSEASSADSSGSPIIIHLMMGNDEVVGTAVARTLRRGGPAGQAIRTELAGRSS